MSFSKSIGILIENPTFIDIFSGYRNLKALADINHIIGEEEMLNAKTMAYLKYDIAKDKVEPEDREAIAKEKEEGNRVR